MPKAACCFRARAYSRARRTTPSSDFIEDLPPLRSTEAMKIGTGAFDDVFVPGTTTLQTSDRTDENMRRLRRLAEQSERVSVSVKPLGTHDRDFDPVVWTRLQVFGELYQLGQRYHFRAADNPARRWTSRPRTARFSKPTARSLFA